MLIGLLYAIFVNIRDKVRMDYCEIEGCTKSNYYDGQEEQ